MSDREDDDHASEMDDGPSEEGDSPSEGRRSRFRLWPRSWRGVAFAGLLLFVLAFGCWLGVEAMHAKSSLEEARGNAQKTKDALTEGKPEDAAKWVSEALSDAQRAHGATHSVPWNIASAVPWLGSPFKTGQQISDVVLGLVADVLKPSVNVGEAISPNRLLAENGHVDVQLLRDAAPELGKISTAATRLNAQAGAISEPKYLSVMRDARATLQTQTSDLSGLLDDTALAARLAPSMMGADGPRNYFIAFQTNAEARGTGGLLGGFGILRFDNGVATVETLGKNNELATPRTPIDLGAEFTAQYGYENPNPTIDSRNSNTSSHFPYAAQIWKSMWEQQSGTKVDGVISIDPIALSYILGAVGPVTMPDGEVITKDNVVELTESTSYVRFADDNDARKNYLQDVASEVVRKLTGHLDSPRQLLDALGKSVGERRIAVWSSTPDEQAILEETPLAHEVPDDPAPYAGVVINNLGGNKLDYYLTRHIEYSAGSCDHERRPSTVTIRLTNKVPDMPLPDYVAAPNGLQGVEVDVPKHSNLTSVSFLATKGSALAGVYVNGTKVPTFKGMERGHPTYEVQLALLPGATVEVKFELSEPTSPGAPRVPIQPLRDEVTPVVSVPTCSG